MYYIGIDIGGTNIKGGLIDHTGHIITKRSIPTPPVEKLAIGTAAFCHELIAEASLTVADITAVGVGIPGMVDSKAGVVRYSNNIRLENYAFVKEFRSLLDLPTYIGNDADVAALGEARFGAGKGIRNLALVTLGTGIGTGVIINGKLLEGSEGGHICIRTDGQPCTCGRKGCFEAYASATALIRQTKEAAEADPSSMLARTIRLTGLDGKTAFTCAENDDPIARQVVMQYLAYLTTGLVNLANLFQPECLLIGGGLSNADVHYFNYVADQVNAQTFGHEHRVPIRILPAILRNDAGILGAGGLAMEAVENMRKYES